MLIFCRVFVQESNENMSLNTKIFYRIYPEEKQCFNHMKILEDHKTIYIQSLQDHSLDGRSPSTPTFWIFRTHRVFLNSPQDLVYETVTENLVQDLLSGKNCVITAFGQTGSGKSLTVNGIYNQYKDRGILPRLISDIFKSVSSARKHKSTKTSVQISYFENCGSKINDLLKPYRSSTQNVKDLSKVKVRNENDAMELLFIGDARKIFLDSGDYPSNRASSVFTFHIHTKNKSLDPAHITSSQLHVLDLAGADTVGNTTSDFKTAKDVGFANLLKSQMGMFFKTLCSPQTALYQQTKRRISPIISFIGDSLNCKTILRFIGHVRMERENTKITLSMLKFGQVLLHLNDEKSKMKRLDGSNKKKTEVTLERVRELESELSKLKSENFYKSLLAKENYSFNMGNERYSQIRNSIDDYLHDKIDSLALTNITDVTIMLEIFKKMLKKSDDIIREKSTSPRRDISNLSNNLKTSGLSVEDLQKRCFKSKTLKSSPRVRRNSTKDKLKSNSFVSTTSKTSGSKIMKKKDSFSRKSSMGASKNSSNKMSLIETNKHKSISSAGSISSFSAADRKQKSKSKTSYLLFPEMIPEHKDAWRLYLVERKDEYTSLRVVFEQNENHVKKNHQLYNAALENMRKGVENVEDAKEKLMQARFSKQFKYYYEKSPKISEIRDIEALENCCVENLRQAENSLVTKQETVYHFQEMLRTHVAECRRIKNELQSSFDAFCKVKYEITVMDSGSFGNNLSLADIDQVLSELNTGVSVNKDLVVQGKAKENIPLDRFEYYKKLGKNERRKIAKFKKENLKWTFY